MCPSRRSYLRHRDRISQKRARQRQEQSLETIQLPLDETFEQIVFAVLIVYREAGEKKPIHAIAAQVWQGQHPIAAIAPVHCEGMVPSQVHRYIGLVLRHLGERYGIRKFASLERFDSHQCPIRPCFMIR